MRNLYSYFRLLLGSWVFMGGIALQFFPSAAATEREGRWRERQLPSIPSEERLGWIEKQDERDAEAQVAVRMTGIAIGGLGFMAALHEVAYLSARYQRRFPSSNRRTSQSSE